MIAGTHRLGEAIVDAADVLAAAGVGSPRFDAEELAAHAAGIERGRLRFLDDVDDDVLARYTELVAARSRRVPLQHLTGVAAFGPVLLAVGPGVFIPRPETESMLEWVTQQRLSDAPVLIDLCTGSGALAVALAKRWPAARVLAVDDAPAALDYARRNSAGTQVEVVHADVTRTDLLSDLDASVDVVVSNPPYIPDGAVLEPEVAEHDPHHALFGGADGMAIVAAVTTHAGRLLRPGGLFAVEHDDSTSELTAELVAQTGLFADVTARRDLTGRPRFVTAIRKGSREQTL